MGVPFFINLAGIIDTIKVMGGKETPYDNELIATHYSCECGQKMKIIRHRYNISREKQVLDTYVLNCLSCGEQRVLFFQMPLKKVKKALEDDLKKIVKLVYEEKSNL